MTERIRCVLWDRCKLAGLELLELSFLVAVLLLLLSMDIISSLASHDIIDSHALCP